MYGIAQSNYGPQQNFSGSPFAAFGQQQGLAGFGLGQQQGLNGLGLGQQQGLTGVGLEQQNNGIEPLFMMLAQALSALNESMMQQQLQALATPNADFGGTGASGGSPGVSDFLGGGGGGGYSPSVGGGGGGGRSPSVSGGGGGGASSVDNSAPTAISSDFGNVPAWGAALAKDAEKHATGSGGLCFRYVRQALERAGVKGVGGASAYMAADQLAKNPKFREIKVAEKDLKKLPAGAVVVWDRGNGHQHGHISIALGGGREASDVKRNQITGYGTKFRVFLPK